MKKNTLILFLILFYEGFGISQQILPELITSSGGFGQSSDASIAWSLGEVSIDTYFQNEVILTQGFHQVNLEPLAANENELLVKIIVFPNPTSRTIAMSLENLQALPLEITLSNQEGKVLTDEKMTTLEHEIDLINFPSGIYLLTLRDHERKLQKTYKILKY